MLGCVLGGAALLTRARYAHLGGAARVVAFGTLASTGLLAVHLAPAALGLLSRGSVAVASLAWLAAAWRVPRVAAERERAPEPVPREAPAAVRVLAVLAVAVVGLYLVAVARNQLVQAPLAIDVLNFHMPGVVSWIETGSIWQIDAFLPDVAPGHYPNHGDVVLLAAVLPWHNDFLAHFTMYPFWALTGVGVYALARELRAHWSLAALVACLLITIPAVSIPALAGSLVDSVMLFGFAAGLLFLVRHFRNGRTSELVLAGLALGLSFGTKWYAVSSVAVVVAAWVVAALVARRPLAAVVRQGLALVAVIALSGGVWLLRNLVESGNPLFPVKVELLGITIFDAPPDRIRQLAGFTIADYVDQPDIWSEYLLPQFRDTLAGPTVAILAGLVAAIVALVLARRAAAPPRRRLALAAAATAVVLALVYAITPYTAAGPENQPVLAGADSRYLIPALVVAAAAAAWAAGRFRAGAVAFAALAALAILDGLRLASIGVGGGPDLTRRDVVVAVGAGIAAGAVVVLLRALTGQRRRVVAGALAAVAVASAAAVGYEVQDRFNDGRYLGRDAVVDTLLTEVPAGHEVGLAGLWTDDGIPPVYPAFGPRFGNEVEYVGRLDQDVIRRYASGREFGEALRRGGYDYLVIGRGRPPEPKAREERWAEAAGFESVARSDRLTLYRAQAAE